MKAGAAGIQRMAEMRPNLAEELKEATVVVPEIAYRDAMSLNFAGRSINSLIWGRPTPSGILSSTSQRSRRSLRETYCLTILSPP